MNKMIKDYRHIALWLCSTLILLCTACGSSDGEPEGGETAKNYQLQLNIYTPEHPVVTRGEMVNPNENGDENVNTMDIWVFASQTTEHIESGTCVGYVHVDVEETSRSSFEGGTYQMSVGEDFVNEHPNVNVYVAANVVSANTGITLPNKPTEEQLNAALLAGDYFGLTSPTSIPPSDGLPMSGVLKNKVINYSRTPLLSVDDPVKVVRAVSKVRFIFSRTNTGDELHINSISLDNDTNSGIPEKEYLFLSGPYDDSETPRYRIGGGYLDAKTVASDLGSIPIPTCTYPARYAFDPNNAAQQIGQAYENLIDDGLTGHYTEEGYSKGEPFELVELKRFYLRESNQRLQGKINYTIGSKTADATFKMYEGDIFTRNHTWIVFGYFAGKETLKVSCVNVTDWKDSSTDHTVHNW